MLMRGLVLIAAAAVIGLSLLTLRQRQLELASEMIDLTLEIERERRSLWNAQAAWAREATPERIRAGVEAAGLVMEHPASPDRDARPHTEPSYTTAPPATLAARSHPETPGH